MTTRPKTLGDLRGESGRLMARPLAPYVIGAAGELSLLAGRVADDGEGITPTSPPNRFPYFPKSLHPTAEACPPDDGSRHAGQGDEPSSNVTISGSRLPTPKSASAVPDGNSANIDQSREVSHASRQGDATAPTGCTKPCTKLDTDHARQAVERRARILGLIDQSYLRAAELKRRGRR